MKKSMNPQVNRAACTLDAKQYMAERAKLWRFRDDRGWRVVTEVELEALGWMLQANELLADESPSMSILADAMVSARWTMFLKENRRWEPSTENGGVRVDRLGYVWRNGAMSDLQMEDIDDWRVIASEHADYDLIELCERALDGCALATAQALEIIEQRISDAADRDHDRRLQVEFSP